MPSGLAGVGGGGEGGGGDGGGGDGGGGDGKPGQTAADQSYVKAATLCHASRSSTLLHSSEASAEPVNMSVMADALETSQAARLAGWLKLVSLSMFGIVVTLETSQTSGRLKAVA